MSKQTLQLLQKAKSKSQGAKLYCKDFALPNLKISTFYQDYSVEIKKVFLEIFTKQEVSQRLQDLLAGKIVNHSEQRPALHHYYRNSVFKRMGFDLVNAVETLQRKIIKGKYKNVDHMLTSREPHMPLFATLVNKKMSSILTLNQQIFIELPKGQ